MRQAGCQLPQHFAQRRKRRIDGTGARLVGVFKDTIEPAVDKENGALARLLIGTGGIPRGKAQATDIAQPTCRWYAAPAPPWPGRARRRGC